MYMEIINIIYSYLLYQVKKIESNTVIFNCSVFMCFRNVYVYVYVYVYVNVYVNRYVDI